MRKIDISTWKRRKYYDFYKDYSFPHFSITIDLDITDFITHIKEKGRSFFPSFLYLVMKALNDIDELKTRIRDDEIWLHDCITPSYTVLNDEQLYVFCTTAWNDDYDAFTAAVRRDIKLAKQSDRLEDIPGKDDLCFVSSLPWESYTQMSHPIDTKHPDSFPRITFGKYTTKNGLVTIPLTVFAHHGLCDGYNIHRYFERIRFYMQAMIEEKI